MSREVMLVKVCDATAVTFAALQPVIFLQLAGMGLMSLPENQYGSDQCRSQGSSDSSRPPGNLQPPFQDQVDFGPLVYPLACGGQNSMAHLCRARGGTPTPPACEH